MVDIAQLIVEQNIRIETHKRTFTDAATTFARTCEQPTDAKLKRDALLDLHNKGKSYFSCVESCIVEGCVAGALEHPAWLNDTVGSADKVLRGVLTFYNHLRRHRKEIGLKVGTFEPSGNIFQNMQSILALSRPEIATELKQQFAASNLPNDCFEKPMKLKPMKPDKNNPWISGSFYLFTFVIVMATLATLGKILNIWVLPLLIVGGLFLITIIGAFQLRNDSRIEEKNFLTLMKLAFQKMPLIGKLLPNKKSE